MVFTAIISIAIYAPQVCAFESAFIRNNLAKTYEGTFKWYGANSAEEFILIWLISIPVISLIALYSKKKSKTIRSLLAISVLYNCAAVVILIWHAITMLVAGAHPVAFAITEQFYSYVIAAIAGINSIVIGKKIWHY